MRRGIISVLIFVAFAAIFTLSRHNDTPTKQTTTATSAQTTTTTATGTDCQATDFSGVYNEGEGAAGTIYASVSLTKSTTGTCTLSGWPLLTLQDKLGAVLATKAVDVPSAGNSFAFQAPQANAKPSSISLGQNDVTTFSIAYSDVQTGTAACESADTVSVQFVAGGPSVAVTPSFPVQPCNGGQIWISPFY